MDGLDILKKDWNKENQTYDQVSEFDIYKMLHKNSSSTVKWILIIGIIEFMLWTGIGFFFNSDEYIKSIHAEEMGLILRILTYANYVVVLFFIYKFYQNFIKISTMVSTKQLMKDILQTRRTVQYYVYYNLVMMAVSMILGFVIAFFYNPKTIVLKDKMVNDTSNLLFLKIMCLLLLVLILFLGMFWLFYKLLYGFLLRKLKSNYNELRKIEI